MALGNWFASVGIQLNYRFCHFPILSHPVPSERFLHDNRSKQTILLDLTVIAQHIWRGIVDRILVNIFFIF